MTLTSIFPNLHYLILRRKKTVQYAIHQNLFNDTDYWEKKPHILFLSLTYAKMHYLCFHDVEYNCKNLEAR